MLLRNRNNDTTLYSFTGIISKLPVINNPGIGIFVLMPHHEPKTCPRCNAPFECKVGNVAECQCNGITFHEDEKHYIAQQYPDCLCRKCLLEIKHEIRLKEFNTRVKRIVN